MKDQLQRGRINIINRLNRLKENINQNLIKNERLKDLDKNNKNKKELRKD